MLQSVGQVLAWCHLFNLVVFASPGLTLVPSSGGFPGCMQVAASSTKELAAGLPRMVCSSEVELGA